MHRSGTSAATRALNLCGLALPDDLLRAGGDNPDGFWEPRKIVLLHEAALASAGLSWRDPRPFPAHWFDTSAAADLRLSLWQAIEPDLTRRATVLVKDPRLCRLVPLWHRISAEYAVELRYIIIVRNPLDVAASLGRRDAIPPPEALLLWLRHVLEAERSTRGVPRGFASYEAVLRDGARPLRSAAGQAGIALETPADEADRAIEAFLNTERRHHSTSPDTVALTGNVSEWVKVAYGWMQDASNGRVPDPSALDDVGKALAAADLLLTSVLSAHMSLGAELHRKLEDATGAAHEADAARRKMEADAALLRAELSLRAQENDRLRREVSLQRRERQRLASVLDDIRDSPSWRLTAPLRALACLMNGRPF